MRVVRLTFGPGHVLIMATVFVGGCNGATDSRSDTSPGAGSPGTGGAQSIGSVGGAGFESGGASTISTAAGGATTPQGASRTCEEPPAEFAWADCTTATGGTPSEYPYPSVPSIPIPPCNTRFTVPVAPEGTPPTIADLCASSETPVVAGWAARITLTDVNGVEGTATGHVTLAPELAAATVSKVEVAVAEHDDRLGDVEIGSAQREGKGFVFSVTFSNPSGATAKFPRLMLTAKLTVDCGGTARSIVSTTALYRCEDRTSNVIWVSAGDQCRECGLICEMVAGAIVPPASTSHEPLGQVVRAQVAQIGQYGSALLLQAQHDGGPDRFAYEWDVSAGNVLWQEKDLLLWAPPLARGEHLVQVSLLAEDAAAIASTRTRCQPVEDA